MILSEWEKSAKSGDWLVYYTGHLAADSDPLQSPKGMASEVGALGQTAFAMYRTGYFELAQRRSATIPNVFDYMIVKRRTRDPIPRPGMVDNIRFHHNSKPRKED